MKTLIILFLLLGTAWAGDYQDSGALTRENPTPAHWEIRSVPLAEAAQLMSEGWEPFAIYGEAPVRWVTSQSGLSRYATGGEPIVWLKRRVR